MYRQLLALGLVLATLGLVGCKKDNQTPATDTQSTAVDTTPAATTAPVVTVDSVPSADQVMIYYNVRGEGDKSLVFVHCWSCDRSYWQNQVDEFARDYKVVTIDLAGHGQSGTARIKWTMAAFGEDVAAVVSKLNLQNVVLIGHSMGGPVVIEAARRLPGKVFGIVGVDNFQDFREVATKRQVLTFVERFKSDFRKTTVGFVYSMFPPTADSTLMARIALDMASAPPEIAMAAITETLQYDYKAALAEVRVPIRTISSDQYPTFAEANNQVAASFAVRIISATGHFPHLVNPPKFNELLHETLADFWHPATQ
jgi:pimeloyl-ACP methyl ester carboxylesterase